MQSKSFLGYSPLGFHRIAYVEWGVEEGPSPHQASQRPPVICAHALTRNGRDFDRLAETLQNDRHLFCPDIAGRGKSDFLIDPVLYGYPQYLNDMTAFIALAVANRTDAAQIDWIGTSMGGIIGMLLAAAPNSPIRKLVINDVGPFIPLAALQRIGAYVGTPTSFANVEELEHYIRKIYAPFGNLNAADWQHMAKHSARNLPDGKLTLAHDTAIAKNFQTLTHDVDFWSSYDQIRCPVLLLRGKQSDVLPIDVAQQMTRRGPKAKLIEFENTGHAPALMDKTQIGTIAEFLNS